MVTSSEVVIFFLFTTNFIDLSNNNNKNSWSGITRRNNLIELCENNKGKIDAEKMMEIINKTVEEGGAKNDLTVYQLVVVPKTKTLWLQITGGSEWTKIDVDSFFKA